MPELSRSRPRFSVFGVVVVVPAIASVLAFSLRWGVAGLIIGAMALANCAAIMEWLRLPDRRFFLCRYFVRIVMAWVGAMLAFTISTPRICRGPEETLEEVLGWLALGWLVGWLVAVRCEAELKKAGHIL